MKQISLRALAVATATTIAVGGVTLGVGAWTEQPAGPTALLAAAGPLAAEQQREADRQTAAREAAQKQAAREKAAREKAAREKAAREKAAREKAAREKAAREKAAREEAARDRAAREEAERASRDAARDPRGLARAMVSARGWSDGEFSCLDSLWQKESGWSATADNPTSSAYGIPQALPGSKMASAGADWETNPATQIEWGLGYIAEVYGSPCGAWEHSQAVNWY